MQKGRLGKSGLEVSALASVVWASARAWAAEHPRGRHRDHPLDENLSALDVHLTAEDLKDIDRAASQIEVHGARYPEPLLKLVGR